MLDQSTSSLALFYLILFFFYQMKELTLYGLHVTMSRFQVNTADVKMENKRENTGVCFQLDQSAGIYAYQYTYNHTSLAFIQYCMRENSLREFMSCVSNVEHLSL